MVRLSQPPGLCVRPELHLGTDRVDVGAADEIATDLIQEPLGIGTTIEVLRALGTTG